MKNQIVSKKRVADHGEVYTADREVNAMLDLVKQETERIDSRFLEPACGTGNFLVEILNRKLQVVEKRYKNNQIDYEKYSIQAISSIYGIDLLEDNVIKCRERLYELVNDKYEKSFSKLCKNEYKETIKYILQQNIIWGDALTLKKVDDKNKPIIFAEWSFVSDSMIKRRDFAFHELLSHANIRDTPLFSDQGEDVFIDEPVKEYGLIHFMKVKDAEQL